MAEDPIDPARLAVLRGLREHLQRTIIGQNEAVRDLCDGLLAGELGHTPRGRPRSLILVLGPTGTGKTKAITEAGAFLHGTGCVARVNCAEFSSEERVPLLLGTAAGARGLLGDRIAELRASG